MMRREYIGPSRTPAPTNETGTKPVCFGPERRTGGADMETVVIKTSGRMEQARLDEGGDAA